MLPVFCRAQGQSLPPGPSDEQNSTRITLHALLTSGAGLVCHCSTGSTSRQATTKLLVYLIVDGKCSFDELFGAPLPQVEYSGSSKSVNDRDPDRGTHPTQVLRYENYNDHVKERLQQADVQV